MKAKIGTRKLLGDMAVVIHAHRTISHGLEFLTIKYMYMYSKILKQLGQRCTSYCQALLHLLGSDDDSAEPHHKVKTSQRLKDFFDFSSVLKFCAASPQESYFHTQSRISY